MAENLFLRRQLGLYQERKASRRRPCPATKLALVILSRFFDWSDALAIVKPNTFTRWHRIGFRLFWRWQSRKSGRPQLPRDVRVLIVQMAKENPTWGEERIRDELSLKLGLHIDSRTIRKYLKQGRPRKPSDQRRATLIRNHAKAIVACDFFVSVTATFKIVYVFVAMEVGSRRILHLNTTEHPTAEWTIQQFREIFDEGCHWRFVIHDRHSTFSTEVDAALSSFGDPCTEDTRANADRKCLLREANRHHPPRMPGLLHTRQ